MRCLNCHHTNVVSTSETCPHCGIYFPALLRDILPPETVLKDHYRIKDVLGRGSFGITYHAEHLILNHSVAIKEFYPQDYATRNLLTGEISISNRQEATYRRGLKHFIQEGRILVKLQHPNVIKLKGLFEERNTAYLVMDLIEGKTLTSILASQRGHKLPPQQVQVLMEQLVSALAAIHEAGIYHLDLKPDNILLTNEQKLVLIDFGAAKQAASSTGNQTRFFTESYAAPELISGGEVGRESDIFELGMLLYELLTGTLPKPAIKRLVEGDTWTPEPLAEPWHTLVLNAIQLERLARPNNVQQWWEGRKCKAISILKCERKDQLVASLRGSFVLSDLKQQGMQQRLGRGNLKAVFPLNHQLLIVAAAGGTTLFDLGQNEALWEIDCPTDCATLSPSGTYLALAWKNVIFVWSLVTGVLVQQLTGHEKPIKDLAFDPTNQFIASASEDQTIAIWDMASSKVIKQLSGHHWSVTSVAFSPDGRWLASGSRDQTINLWELNSGEVLRCLLGHTQSVERVVFSPDGQLLISGSRDRSVRVWEVESGKLLNHLQGHTGWITDLAVSSDNNLLASASGIDDKSILIWDLMSGQCLSQLRGHWNSVKAIAFCPESYLLVSAGYDYSIRLWDIASTQTLTTLHQHTNWVYSVACSPDHRWVASGNNDRTVRVWDTLQQRQVAQLVGHDDLVSSVVFSPDGQTLASGSWDQTIRLWNIRSGKLVRVLQGHQGAVYSIAISPNGQWLASGSGDRSVRLWEINRERWLPKKNKTMRVMEGHLNDVRAIAFSPDSLLVASGSYDQTIHIWEVASGQEIYCLIHDQSQINCIAFHPQGVVLASAGEQPIIYLWDITKGKVIGQLMGHQARINSIAFSSDGNWLVSGSADHSVKLWDINSGQLLQSWLGHTHVVNSVVFSQNGTFVITGDHDGVIRHWQV